MDYIDWNHDWNYPLQWLQESEPARMEYHKWLWRANLAKMGKPQRNFYQEEIFSNIDNAKCSGDKKSELKSQCQKLPEGKSFAIKKAIDNIANQMSAGVDTYEYQINDPYMIIDPDTEDLLAAKCKQDYITNKLDILSSTFSRDITSSGVSAVLVKYDPITDKNQVLRVNPKNIWFDTKYSSTGEERFRGYSTMISWKKLKQMIVDGKDEINLNIKAPDRSIIGIDGKTIDKSAKYGNKKIRTVNGLDIYVESINKLATAPNLSAFTNLWEEYDHDLRNCYNLNWYQSFANDSKKRTNSLYGGDDVELTVMYDLVNHIEFKIINRRYVISANQRAFHRKIAFNIKNPTTGESHVRLDDFTLDCPLKFQFSEQENMDKFPFPWAPIFPLLDVHDRLCSWRAKREHVSTLLSILRIATNAADAESIRGKLNIMGIVLDDIQGDVTTLAFPYDYTPIDTEIAYLEKTIQECLHAYDQFDAMQAMGDRATAAESGMALSAVAQGLATHQNSIMRLYADIARQCIANRVAYSSADEFPVSTLGGNSSITIQQMALDAIIDVKPALAKQIRERSVAANSLQIIGTLGQQLNQEGIAYLMEQALMGSMPKGLARHFIRDDQPTKEEYALAQQQAQNDARMMDQNQRAYEQNPVPYEAEEVMNNNSPEDIDQIIAGLGGEEERPLPDGGYTELSEDTTGSFGNDGPQVIESSGQEGALSTGGVKGMTPEVGGMYANPEGIY